VTLSAATHSAAVRVSQNASSTDLSHSSSGASSTIDVTPPALTGFTPVSSNPRNTPVSSIDINFADAVYTLPLTDFTLQNGSTVIPLTSASVTPSGDFKTWHVNGLSSLTGKFGTNWNLTLSSNAGIYDAAGNVRTGSPISTSWVMYPWQNLNANKNI